MCIIVVKPQNIAMPPHATLEQCWKGNPHGGGYMYAKENKVHIRKGFMSEAEMWNDIERQGNLTDYPVVLHYRHATHGSVSPANTHPFPCDATKLRDITVTTDLGIVHNGIVSIPVEGDNSDTMQLIKDVFEPCYNVFKDCFKYENTHDVITTNIGSKYAFLYGDGSVYTVGAFLTDNGIHYSNGGYRPYQWGSYSRTPTLPIKPSPSYLENYEADEHVDKPTANGQIIYDDYFDYEDWEEEDDTDQVLMEDVAFTNDDLFVKTEYQDPTPSPARLQQQTWFHTMDPKNVTLQTTTDKSSIGLVPVHASFGVLDKKKMPDDYYFSWHTSNRQVCFAFTLARDLEDLIFNTVMLQVDLSCSANLWHGAEWMSPYTLAYDAINDVYYYAGETVCLAANITDYALPRIGCSRTLALCRDNQKYSMQITFLDAYTRIPRWTPLAHLPVGLPRNVHPCYFGDMIFGRGELMFKDTRAYHIDGRRLFGTCPIPYIPTYPAWLCKSTSPKEEPSLKHV